MTEEQLIEWRRGLKKGDPVVLVSRGYPGHRIPTVVAADRSGGGIPVYESASCRAVWYDWSKICELHPPTPEELEVIEARMLAGRVESEMERLAACRDLDKLRRIVTIIEENVSVQPKPVAE